MEQSMKLIEILNFYPIETLEQLAANKIQDIDHIRLPKEVLVEELNTYLQKYPYVQKAISLRNPPSYLILSKIIDNPSYKIPINGFKETVKKETENFIQRATKGDGLRTRKDYDFYLKMLQIAWESDDSIDASEARLLTGLREELDITFTEHIILEHHESLKVYWFSENYYERERNHLIANGIIFPHEGYFLIPEEIVPLIRKVWGYSLSREQYLRLLSQLSGQDLINILKRSDLQVSGNVDEKANRIIENYISPKKSLNLVSIETLRDVARKIGSPISGSKSDVMENIIDFMNDNEDLRVKEEQEKSILPLPLEEKTFKKEIFQTVFSHLSNDQIYSMASSLRKIRKSGSKIQKIDNLWDSDYSEKTLLAQLSNAELYELCSNLNVKVAGSKQEKVDRIVSNFIDIQPVNEIESNEEDATQLIRQSTRGVNVTQIDDRTEGIIQLEQQYPYLNKEELMILSFVIDNKNLSGQELERLIARFDLPWYYPSVQMNEMIQKLQKNGHDIVSTRQYGDYPIYALK
jgi:hypothetical protein